MALTAKGQPGGLAQLNQAGLLPGSQTSPAVSATTQSVSYTLALADAGTVVESTSATPVNITVPPEATVAFTAGTVIEVVQYGAGQVTVVAGVGVTVRSPATLTSRARYSSLAIRKRASDEWVVSGDLT